MSPDRRFDVAILGGGPAGLVSALVASKFARVGLVLNQMPFSDTSLRIDSVPARTLALLVELGIDPRVLGVESLHCGRWASWEVGTPAWHSGAQTAQIERPCLERALFEAVCATGLVTVIVDGTRPRWAKGFVGTGWRAQTLIDATGRASVTSRARNHLAQPWASRFFWTPRREISSEFRIAALSCGYVYRLGSADHIGIGIAGRGRWLNLDPLALEQLLCDEGAGWLLEGLPPIASMALGASGTTSVQWAGGGHAVLVGDAAISRDSLSSQGLAASISDALYATAAVKSGDLKALRERHSANFASHLHYLTELVNRCRFLEMPLWHTYQSFLAKTVSHQAAASNPVLRNDRLIAADDSQLDTIDSRLERPKWATGRKRVVQPALVRRRPNYKNESARQP